MDVMIEVYNGDDGLYVVTTTFHMWIFTIFKAGMTAGR